jgi:DNA-directed RNA polymerase specialized sigma24 family protein
LSSRSLADIPQGFLFAYKQGEDKQAQQRRPMNDQNRLDTLPREQDALSRKRRTFTRTFNAEMDKAFATGDTEKLNSFLRSKAKQFAKHDEDAVEYIMERLPKRLEKYQPDRIGKSGKTARFSTFITTVIRNLVTDWWRSVHLGKMKFFGDLGGFPDGCSSGNYVVVSCQADEEEGEPAPSRRSQREWWVLALRARRDGANDEQMAEMLGGKPSSVPATLSRWRRKLRAQKSINT